jgi:hypothetical protein
MRQGGRAHSRYLDRLEARSNSIQLFLGGSPDCADRIKPVDHLAAEKDRNSTSLASAGIGFMALAGARPLLSLNATTPIP